MSRTSTITIRGRVARKDDYDPLLDFIKRECGSVEIDGCVQGAVIDEDGMDFVCEPIKGDNPFEFARSLLGNGRLSSIDCHLEIGGEQRFFNFDAHYNDRLVITINSNRYTLEDGTTDFSWYYENLVSKLGDVVMEVNGIAFCDDL